MSKSINFIVILFITMSVALTSYAQQKKDVKKQQKIEVKEIEHQPIVIVAWEEEDVDELLEGIELDSMLFEIGIGGDEMIPASDIYSSIWSNSAVNPYKHEPIVDTLPINLASYNFPLKKHYRVNSEFGQRRRRYHYGIDLKVNVGDTVVSSLGGMVRIASENPKTKKKGYGYFVVVRHFNGLETFYGHLDKVLVQPNQMVTAGELIGLAGNTGRSTGPHLHYEFRYQGRPISPRDVVDFDSTLNVHNETFKLNASHFVYPKKSSKVKAKSTSGKTVSGSATSKGVWTVKDGDNLGSISAKTGTSINKLCELNNITRKTILKLGRKIKY